MYNDKKVILGMSGGTDSSVAAIRLLEQGYEVVGVTFRFYDSADSNQHISDAISLANKLSIRHILYDAREDFQKHIIDYFVDEYISGRTPVPCTICNNKLKWPLLIKIADEEKAKYISTGHYINTINIKGKYFITSAKDEEKDQTFFLWGLTQEVISRMLLPMGSITKAEARLFAKEKGFHKVSTKKDSIGVCFCSDDYRKFIKEELKRRDSNWERYFQKGRFIDENNNTLGYHDGYPLYTIGQRRGLGLNLNKALFVNKVDIVSNQIMLTSLSKLEKNKILLESYNIVDENMLFASDDIIIKIRYRKQINTGRVSIYGKDKLLISLNEPLTAVAEGQAAAFYKDGLLIGGGIIHSSW